jgi:HSP20 family protein
MKMKKTLPILVSTCLFFTALQSSSAADTKVDAKAHSMNSIDLSLDPFAMSLKRLWTDPLETPLWFGRLAHEPFLGLDYSSYRSMPAGWEPRVNLTETADAMKLTAEVPGIEARDLDVVIKQNRITISGKKEVGDKALNGKSERVEQYESFERVMELPYKIDEDKAVATLKNGVLTITAPKLARGETDGKKLIINVQ